MSAMSGNREATSGCMSGVGQKLEVDLWLGGNRCRAGSRESTSDLAVEDVWPGARVGVVFGRLLRKAVSATPGKYFRF